MATHALGTIWKRIWTWQAPDDICHRSPTCLRGCCVSEMWEQLFGEAGGILALTGHHVNREMRCPLDTYLPLGGLGYVANRAGPKLARAGERAIVRRVDLARRDGQIV